MKVGIKKRLKTIQRLGACAAILAAHPGLAQTQTPPAVAGQDSGGGLQEIVVSAERRSESLQDVPVSVSVLSADAAKAMGITSTEDLTTAVPGLVFSRTSNAGVPYIRGIGNNNPSLGDESAVAVYVDGVYIPSLIGNILDLNSIQQVEVLKGPQGTLFGRNATGGVIQIITKQPSQTPSLDAEIGYGNYGTAAGRVYGTTGITPSLAADFAGFYENESEGFGTNLATGQPAYRARSDSFRSKWQLTLEDTDVTLSLDTSQRRDEQGTAIRQVDGYLIGGIVVPGFYNVDQNNSSYSIVHDAGVSLTVKHDLHWAQFVSISSYRESSEHLNVDADYTPLPLIFANIQGSVKSATEELQLLSPDSSKLKWIGGFFYFYNDATLYPFGVSGEAVYPVEFFNTDDTQKTHSYSGFGQLTYPVLEQLRVSAGVRYTSDTRKLTGAEVTNYGPVFLTPAQATFDNTSYRASVDYDLAAHVLAYATYSTGFKSGIYNTYTPTDPVVKPETLDATELGLKTDLLDNTLRINLAGYFYKFDDIQLDQVNVTSTSLTNASRAKARGLDLDADYLPLSALTLHAGVSYLITEFTNYPDGVITSLNPAPAGGLTVQSCTPPDSCNLTGRELPLAPHMTLNAAASYTLSTPIGTFVFNATDYYNDGYYWAPENRLRQNPYDLLNGGVEWDPSPHWALRLWGKNLTNREYYSYAESTATGDTGSPADPRTYGIAFVAHAF
jgi:iron complex outermembrane receptor protein